MHQSQFKFVLGNVIRPNILRGAPVISMRWIWVLAADSVTSAGGTLWLYFIALHLAGFAPFAPLSVACQSRYLCYREHVSLPSVSYAYVSAAYRQGAIRYLLLMCKSWRHADGGVYPSTVVPHRRGPDYSNEAVPQPTGLAVGLTVLGSPATPGDHGEFRCSQRIGSPRISYSLEFPRVPHW